MCDQFFRSNIRGEPANHQGSAELFNIKGRRERNSFVDVIQSGPERVWVTVDTWRSTSRTMRSLTCAARDYFAYPTVSYCAA